MVDSGLAREKFLSRVSRGSFNNLCGFGRRFTFLGSTATGYIGSRLLLRLQQRNVRVRCLARKPGRLRTQVAKTTEIVKGDVLDRATLDAALAGVTTAYYLVHLMASSADFEKQDREAAENFGAAAKEAGVQRIIFRSGLGEESDPNLSPQLRSRREVGRILRDSGVETIEFRASVVVGSGSLSFDLIQSLTNRLPVMICPKGQRRRLGCTSRRPATKTIRGHKSRRKTR